MALNRYGEFFLHNHAYGSHLAAWGMLHPQQQGPRRIPFFRVNGTLEERVSQVNDVLLRHRKFGNLLEIYLTLLSAVLDESKPVKGWDS